MWVCGRGWRTSSGENVCVYNTHAVIYTQMKFFSSQKSSYPEEVHHDLAWTRETECLLWDMDLTKLVPRLSTQEMSMAPAKGH